MALGLKSDSRCHLPISHHRWQYLLTKWKHEPMARKILSCWPQFCLIKGSWVAQANTDCQAPANDRSLTPVQTPSFASMLTSPTRRCGARRPALDGYARTTCSPTPIRAVTGPSMYLSIESAKRGGLDHSTTSLTSSPMSRMIRRQQIAEVSPWHWRPADLNRVTA